MKTIKHSNYLYTFLLVLIFVLAACTQYKNKPINRGYHNMTSRFNVYFYAKESLNEGITKLEENHKDDYTKILPVYIYGDKETSKNIYPEMDRVIKKSSVCITRHAIKDKRTKEEIFGAVRWIDNAWMALGKAHFYKREFFPAIETFEFVAHSYKSKEKYEAWLWLVKTYNEMNLLSQSEPYINLIKNEKNFPKQFKASFEVLHAEFYIKQGLYEESIKELTEAISHTKNKKEKARYYFILGQLYETKENDKEKAITQYKKVLAKKPAYEMDFNARIKLAILTEYNEITSQKIKSDLLKMLKDIKNDEYQDVIYYTLGQLEERDRNYDKAFDYYKLSVSKSKTNDVQKSKSYLRIAEMSFDREDYPQSKAYYDSTLAVMKEDAVGYKDVVNKKNSLDVLVGHINTIKTQDSLLKIAVMDSSTRNAYIKELMKKLEEDEKKAKLLKQKQIEDAGNQPLDNGSNNAFQPTAGGTGAWYFYNQETKAFGVNDFIKKWGNQRKNEDNWRRSNKQIVIESWQPGSDTTGTMGDSTLIKKDSLSTVKSVDYYLKNLPLTKALQDSAHKKILNSYYALGTIYREQLNNNKRSISTFVTMNQRYSRNEYEPASYYQMYRMYLQAQNQPKADECKSFLQTNYPNSDYTRIILDPNFASAVNAKKSEVDAFYSGTYDLYKNGNYPQALVNCNEALRKYSKNDYTAKFDYLRALCIGKTQSLDSLEYALKGITQKYPTSDVYAPAKATLDAIQKAKSPNTSLIDSVKIKPVDPDAFKLRDSIAHYWVVCVPQNRGNINAFKTKLSNFNNQFYSIQKYQSQTIMFGTTTVVFLKTFTDKTDVQSYHDFIIKKPEIFEDLQKEVISTFGISEENMILLIKKQNIEDYKTFYNKYYAPKKPL